MALGRYYIDAALDSASDPDDTTLLAAPGANERIYVLWLDVIVTTGQSSATIQMEDGAGGNVLTHAIDASSTGRTAMRWAGDGEGLRLSANTALNATVAGATSVGARVRGEAVVKGA